MKTVAVVARDIGVTPKAIYERLKRVKPGNTEGDTDVKLGETQLDPDALTVKQGGVTYITADGENYLWSCFNKVKPGNTEGDTEVKPGEAEGYTQNYGSETQVQPEERTKDEEIKFLREQLSFTQAQYEKAQDELSAERAHSRDIAKRLATIAENQQKLFGMEQMRTTPALMGEGSSEAEPEKNAPVMVLEDGNSHSKFVDRGTVKNETTPPLPPPPKKKKSLLDSLLNWLK